MSSDAASCDIATILLPEYGDGGAAACLYTLPFLAADPNNIRVYEDGPRTVAVPQSPSNGWEYYDPTFLKIVLNGTYCADAQAGNIPNLYVLSGCLGTPIP